MASPLASVRAQDAVLEFLNTVVPRNGQLLDLFQSDEDVLAWLERTGLLEMVVMREDGIYRGLATEARQLRENVRQLVLQRKLGQLVDTGLLNWVLGAGSYQMELVEDEAGNLNALYRFPAQTPTQVLVPVAIAAAELLVRGDFLLVRQCESPDCPLWFYDRTKSHRRRWCNMTICGNRQKAARFRTRLLCGGLVEQE
ncbi:CGNR zinc finger domain-containing protein [Paraburkholderia edwinii]|jgi:predicted RNA-binding Zn ribbon-like protein|uniref:CGNR zinc finger domain-containing protein n=1 Tax=Paraburkholderia edwinii TaxID=2861782 RepID=A0ABX8URT8_9BURK|nr:CGNR zinc finger domain-containing protein [Paraburkholderia edwinii]QYD71718.1 CGNR zinc finger domain-containing protein [Paraburkholderia edwinii]